MEDTLTHVDRIIGELTDLHLPSTQDTSDVDMALMHLRHLKKTPHPRGDHTMTTIDPDYRYTYTVNAEAWYFTDTRVPASRDDLRKMIVAREHVGGGVAWEFTVQEYDSGPALKISLFHDAWDAFADIPELFEELRSHSPRTLASLRAMLDELGFIDSTTRNENARVQIGSYTHGLPHRTVSDV